MKGFVEQLLHARIGALVLVTIALVVAAWLPISDAMAQERAEAGLTRALASFAVARALNGIISVAQGTEVSIQPAGIGVQVAPGQLLDPLNDLVEQFASLMLAASVAFGVQILLIQIGAHWALSLLLSVVAVAWLASALARGGSPLWLTRTLLVLALARFAVPLTALGNEMVYRAFLAPAYAAAHGQMEHSAEGLRTEDQQAEKSMVAEGADKSKSWWPKIPDVRKIPETIRATAERAVRHMIDLIVIFVLQTVVLPLGFLWLLIAIGRNVGTLGGPPRSARATGETAAAHMR